MEKEVGLRAHLQGDVIEQQFNAFIDLNSIYLLNFATILTNIEVVWIGRHQLVVFFKVFYLCVFLIVVS